VPITIEVLELLTVRECAAIFGTKQRRVQQFIQEGRLKANKIGGRWFVTREEVERFKIIPRKSGNFTGRPRVASEKKTE